MKNALLSPIALISGVTGQDGRPRTAGRAADARSKPIPVSFSLTRSGNFSGDALQTQRMLGWRQEIPVPNLMRGWRRK